MGGLVRTQYVCTYTHTDFTEWSALAGVVMAKWGTEDALDLDSSFTDMMRQAKETLMVCTFFPFAPSRLLLPRLKNKNPQRMDGCSVATSSLPFPVPFFFLPRQSLKRISTSIPAFRV